MDVLCLCCIQKTNIYKYGGQQQKGEEPRVNGSLFNLIQQDKTRGLGE